MSTTLVEYGIQTEVSDIRAHVSVVNRAMYVYKTECGRDAIRTWKPPLKPAWQPGVTDGPTAWGWIVKVEWIQGLIRVPWDAWWNSPVNQDMSTTDKGQWAVGCVCGALKRGLFPLWVAASEADDPELQVSGTDIMVNCRHKIQVKCDYEAGEKPNGTGNLYLQKAERNPKKQH